MYFGKFSPRMLGGLTLALACSFVQPVSAQVGNPNFDAAGLARSIQWQTGPCKVTMRNIGELNVPTGFKFTGEAGTATVMKLTANLVQPNDLGLLCPVDMYGANPGVGDQWFLVFSWDDVGYVKDDEKGNLDANAILQSLQAAQEQANKQLAAQGLPTATLVGWQQAPFYDPQTNHLTWATKVRSTRAMPGGGFEETINYNSRILGRGGVVSANLVIAPHLLDRNLAKYKEILQGYSFQPGQKYSEWRQGDKVAAVGLTALISGGLVAAAAKSGILGKLGKFIIYIVVGVCAAVGGLFKKIFGSKADAQ